MITKIPYSEDTGFLYSKHTSVYMTLRLWCISMTYPNVKVGYVELMEAVNSREQLRQVTNGNTFREVIISNDLTNQLSIRHSGGNKYYAHVIKASHTFSGSYRNKKIIIEARDYCAGECTYMCRWSE